MSAKKENKGTGSFRLNLDEITPEELFKKMKKLQNDALKEAGESISGGAQSGTTVLHSSGAGTFSKSFDPGT